MRLAVGIIVGCIVVGSCITCKKAEDSTPSPQAGAPGAQRSANPNIPPNAGTSTAPATPPPVQDAQAAANAAQQATLQRRQSEYLSRRDAIAKQIQDNESQQAVLRAEIETAKLDIERFRYSGGSAYDNPYYDVAKQKMQALADTLEQRLKLDDQLKALDAQYSDVNH